MKKNQLEKKLINELIGLALKKINQPINLMEVCGTHTVAFFTSGVKKKLAPKINLISGPGCPVCVTSDRDIEEILEISKNPQVIIATFGDLFRVPGISGSLESVRALGRRVEIIYSPLDALKIAQKNPEKKVIFVAVGFETTAPTIAAAVLEAQAKKIKNFFIFPLLKTIPEALEVLFQSGAKIDGLILPGHVSTIIGAKPYQFLVKKFQVPCVIAGFEPLDLAEAVYLLTEMIVQKKPGLKNQYTRVVTLAGNQQAQKIIHQVFQKSSANWRGLGEIPDTGLALRKKFARFDAQKNFSPKIFITQPEFKKFCLCGLILKGQKKPNDCRLFGKRCTPENPVGPCMVSSEGACAAYYKYGR